MTFLKPRKKSPPILLICGVLTSMTMLGSIFSQWDANLVPVDSFYPTSAEREAGQHLDLSVKTYTKSETCMPYIFYDKPIKTGSTSIQKALEQYFDANGQGKMPCGDKFDCGLAATQVCLGIRAPVHMIDHLAANSSVVNCLHAMGFYHVTSIREPKARILSAYKFNKLKGKDHNGISADAPFHEFLEKYPRCVLQHYYDGLTPRCDSNDIKAIEERSANIASRFDEIIELTEQPVSDLHRRIAVSMRMLNPAPLKAAADTEYIVPDEVAAAEYVLYNKLRERRAQLAMQPRRKLCELSRSNLE